MVRLLWLRSRRNRWFRPVTCRRSRPALVPAEIARLETRALLSNTAPTLDDATFTINENLVNGSIVGTVSGADPDVGDILTYAIVGGNTGTAFAINSTTGEVSVANVSVLDFETNPSFSLAVEVTDNGQPNLSDTATVTINLTDVNEAPNLALGSSTEFIDENTSTTLPLVVTSVTIIDDALGNETITLTGADAGFFQVVGSTLRVKAGTDLNFETKDNYTVTVNVNDPTVGLNPDASQTFNLLLNDLAEPPVIANQSFQVIPNSANGTVVGNVTASDPDGGSLTYAIVSGNSSGAFQIDPGTGEITVADSIALVPDNFSLTVQVIDGNNDQSSATISVLSNSTTAISGGVANQPMLDTDSISPFASLVVADADNQGMFVRVSIPNSTRGDFTPASVVGWTRSTSGELRYSRSFGATPDIGSVVQTALRALVFQAAPNMIPAGTEETLGFPLFFNDQLQVVEDNTVSVRITSVNDIPVIDGAVANQAANDNATITPFSSLNITDPDRQAAAVTVTISNGVNRGDFTPASSSGWSRTVNGADIVYLRSIVMNNNIGSELQAAVRALVFQPRTNAITPATNETTAFTVFVNDQIATATDNSTSVISTSSNDAPALAGTTANQPVNDNGTRAPFSTVTVTDPDFQVMSATVRIKNGVVRGDFTPATVAGWTRSLIGNDIQYSRTFPTTANIGAVVQAAVRALVFVPRENAIKPNTTEATAFNITITDGMAAPVLNTATSIITTSVNDAPIISGVNPAVSVNDSAIVIPFASLVISEPDFQEALARITIFNGVVRGDFTNAISTGWTRSVIGNNINYVRYFGPAANNGANVQAAYRALTFQPRQNAIRPGTTELTDFLVSVSDGVATPAVNQGTRVTTISVNDPPSLGGTVAGQTMNDDSTRAVFSTVTIVDPDTQDMQARIIINNGVNRGDFTPASVAGWTRSLSGANIVYNRYFSQAGNIGATVQAAIRALVFQPRTNVPIGTTESTGFTIFVNDGIANMTDSATSVLTTGVAPRMAGSNVVPVVSKTETVAVAPDFAPFRRQVSLSRRLKSGS